MNQFTNSFNCAVDDDKTEVVIHFRQRSPHFDAEKGRINGLDESEIITLVMSARTAAAMANTITDLLSGEDEEEVIATDD